MIASLLRGRSYVRIVSGANIAIGYPVALISQWLIFPRYGFNPPIADNLMIGVWFTAVSLARSYTLRRLFNRWHRKTT
jgi:hypothetical protein